MHVQPENILAVEIDGAIVPEIKLIHFERSREVNMDSDVIVKRLDDDIEYEGGGRALLLNHHLLLCACY